MNLSPLSQAMAKSESRIALSSSGSIGSSKSQLALDRGAHHGRREGIDTRRRDSHKGKIYTCTYTYIQHAYTIEYRSKKEEEEEEGEEEE